SRDEFVGGIMTICTGGLTSTAGATGMMMHFMCRNPEQQEQVRQDPDLIPGAVEETLRCHPAGMAIQPRFSAVETEIGGTVVYPGMPIVPCLPMASYDPGHYENPWEFDVRRTGRHLTFGQGIHMCIGAVLARAIMNATL